MVDWEAIREKLPTEKTAEAKEERKKLFESFDPNNNGYLSLAEVDKGCRDVLGLYEVFEAKKVIMRAFQAAKSVHQDKGGSSSSSVGEDYVERIEFRLLLLYLRQYFEYWQMFTIINSTTDKRISLDEFKSALPKLEKWGVRVNDPDATFKEIDVNGGGMILFDEFAEWAIKKQLDLEEDDD